jgi:hypothetical protein
LSGASFAGTNSQDFNVNVNLTPMCYVNLAAGPGNGAVTDVTLNYTAFQSSAATASTSFVVKCTNNRTYEVSVTSDTGTVQGITYYVSLSQAAGYYVLTTGHADLTGETGNGSSGVTYYVGVQAAGDQPGDCSGAGACSGTQIHTIQLTY